MIFLPPLDLQHRFADFVRATDKSKFTMQSGLDKLELLYQSLMQKCFAGELFN
jgi:restriction endonuclease S subunit